MRQLVLAALVTSLIFLMSSCPTNSAVENPYSGLESRTFWAQNMKTTKFYQLDAVELTVGERCVIWAERSSGVSIKTAERIAASYDNEIYPKMLDVFGVQDITFDPTKPAVAYNTLELADWLGDRDGKLAILLLDIKDTYTPNTPGYVAGYFWSENFYKTRNSNQMDMMYVDTKPGVPGSLSSNSTFAHELQHLMNYATATIRRKPNNLPTLMDTWIDEGLSTAAEYVYQAPNHDKDRIEWFVKDQEGTIARGNNFFVWGNHTEKTAILDDYATDYLFFQWLRLQSGGTGIYKDIITSSDADYKAVTKAAAARIDPAYSDWGTLLGAWLKANYLNAPNGPEGYLGELSTRVWAVAGGTKTLYPGEGVYTISSNTAPANDGKKQFAKLNRNTEVSGLPPGYAAGYTGSRILMYNTNVDQTTTISGNVPGQVSGELKPPPAASARNAFGGIGGPFVIDARDMLRRKGHGRWGDIDFHDFSQAETGAE